MENLQKIANVIFASHPNHVEVLESKDRENYLNGLHGEDGVIHSDATALSCNLYRLDCFDTLLSLPRHLVEDKR